MISPIETGLHAITALVLFFIGYLLSAKVANLIQVKSKIATYIYIWHTFFAMVYMYYTLNYGGDSLRYYREALQGGGDSGFGTVFVSNISSVLVSYFQLSYLGLFLFFNLLGCIALIILHKVLYDVVQDSSVRIRRFALLAVFLPSASFWTSALGKDSISFLAVVLALWAAMKLPKRTVLMALAVFLLLLVRPHVAGIMVMALAGSLLFSSARIDLSTRVLLGIIVIPVSVVLIPFAANYAGIENAVDINEVTQHIESRQGYNLGGGSSLDISGMPVPLQIFTYLFRPLPFEAHSLFALIASLDNLFLLFIFLYSIRYIRVKSNARANHAFLWLYVAGTTLILAMTTANLGIAVRQKWMIMPVLLYLLFAAIAAHQAKKQRIRQHWLEQRQLPSNHYESS